MWFPTAPANGYVGDKSVRGQRILLGGRAGNRIDGRVAGGPEIRATEVFAGVTQGTQFDVGAGIGVLLGDARRLQIGLELYGAFTLASAKTPGDDLKRSTNLELLCDGRYRVEPRPGARLSASAPGSLSPGTPATPAAC